MLRTRRQYVSSLSARTNRGLVRASERPLGWRLPPRAVGEFEADSVSNAREKARSAHVDVVGNGLAVSSPETRLLKQPFGFAIAIALGGRRRRGAESPGR